MLNHILKRRLVLIIFVSFFISSCFYKKDKDVPLFLVSNTNFEDILTIEGFVEAVNFTTIACPRNVTGRISYIIEEGTIVEKGDLIAQIEDEDLQTEYDRLLIELENAEANLSKVKTELEAEYAILEAQVKNNEAETKIAQLDSLQLRYAPPNQKRIKELELDKVTINKGRYEKKLKNLAIIHQSEIRKLELSMQRLANRVKSIKAEIENLTMRAVNPGLAIKGFHPVSNTKIQVGDFVWSMMPLITLPELTEMKVKIFAPERDFKYINVGDSVYYTFDAMPENKAWGKITKKTPVGRAVKQNSKIKHFEIEASIDSSLVLPEIGISATCHVVMQEVKDTIVIPQIAVFDIDSMKFVYKKDAKGYKMQQVLTGASSPKETTITSGLQVNDMITLTKPSVSSSIEKVLLPDSIVNPSIETEEKK